MQDSFFEVQQRACGQQQAEERKRMGGTRGPGRIGPLGGDLARLQPRDGRSGQQFPEPRQGVVIRRVRMGNAIPCRKSQ